MAPCHYACLRVGVTATYWDASRQARAESSRGVDACPNHGLQVCIDVLVPRLSSLVSRTCQQLPTILPVLPILPILPVLPVLPILPILRLVPTLLASTHSSRQASLKTQLRRSTLLARQFHFELLSRAVTPSIYSPSASFCHLCHLHQSSPLAIALYLARPGLARRLFDTIFTLQIPRQFPSGVTHHEGQQTSYAT